MFDAHTHFLRDDTRLTNFVAMRAAVGKAGWNAELGGKEQTIADLKFDNYFKEVFLDSDTKVALLTNSPSDIPEDWFLTNEMVFQTRDRVNRQAGIAPPAGALHHRPRPARLARRHRPRHRHPAAGRLEGLHGRRQHPQGHQPLSLAPR